MQGISLVETLVYIALLNLVILSFWGAYQYYLSQSKRLNAEANASYSSSKIDQSPLTIILSEPSLSPGSTMDLNTYGGSGNGSVTYSSEPMETCTVTGNVLKAEKPGNCLIFSSKAGSLRFNKIDSIATLTIK
jgi:hypothetical protein